MKVILLATGEQKKLSPITDLAPTAMLNVVDRPVMEHNLAMLARQGFKKVWVSLHHLPGSIEGCFGNGQRLGISLEYLLQRDPLGAAGALKWAQSVLDETFLVLPADALFDLDVRKVLEQHIAQENVATVIVSRQGKATGAYLFEPKILELVPGRAPMDIQTQLIPLAAGQGYKVGTYQMNGYWNPLESFQAFQEAQAALLHHGTGLAYLRPGGRQVSPGVWLGKHSALHPTTRITPPVLIGENTRIGRGVELGPDAVIGSNSIVDAGATISASTVLSYTYVGQMVNVKQRVIAQNRLIDTSTGEYVRIVDRFLLDALEHYSAASLVIRAFDILLAILLMVLSLPLTVPIALLLWIDTGRPIETHLRAKQVKDAGRAPYTSQSRFFRLVRFAMQRKDGTQTALTRLVKRWGFSRLPELWNVLSGDLAMVGVHPLTPETLLQSSEAWQEKLREVKPGFTGLWYIQEIYEGDILALQVADAYYAATRTWKKDLELLLKTPLSWLKRRKNYREPVPYMREAAVLDSRR